MRPRRRSELMWFPMTDERFVDLPDNAEIVAVDFHSPAGLMQGRQPTGVWVEIVVRRYDDATDRSYHRDELPPPDRKD